MKVVSSIKPICKDCFIVRRGKVLYLRCKTFPRHKRRQGKFSTLIRQPGDMYGYQHFSPDAIKPMWMMPMTQMMLANKQMQLY